MAWGDTDTVDPAGAGSGGDWTTMAQFEGDHDGDTVTSGDTTALVTGIPSDGAYVIWGGWLTGQDATHKIVVKADTGNAPDGLSDGTGDAAVIDARHIVNNATNPIFMDWTTCEFHVATNRGIEFRPTSSGSQLRVALCYFRDSTGAATGISGEGGAGTSTVILIGACLFKTVASSSFEGAIRTNDSDVTMTAVNCTAVKGGRDGFTEFGGTLNLKNTVAILSSNNDYAGISGTQTTVADGDTTSTGITVDETDSSANTEFTDPSVGNYTIEDTDSALFEAGTTESASWFTTLCPTGLNGVTWRATPAIGCYEFLVAGGPADLEQKIMWFSKLLNPMDFLVAGAVGLIVANPKMTKRELMNPFKYFRGK